MLYSIVSQVISKHIPTTICRPIRTTFTPPKPNATCPNPGLGRVVVPNRCPPHRWAHPN